MIADLVKNKTVAVVGPSACIDGKGYGSEIDNHDIVIRLNRGFNISNENDFGKRTDVVYIGSGGTFHHTGHTLYQKYPDVKVKLVYKDWHPHYVHHRPWYKQYLHDYDNVEYGTECDWIMLHNTIKSTFHPLTGTFALWDIVTQTDASIVSVYGIDMYSSGYSNNLDSYKDIASCKGHQPHLDKQVFNYLKLKFPTKVNFSKETSDSLI